jgi:tetratricopeptide (TPR) repeat protein
MAENPIVFISYSHRDEGWKDQLLPHIRMLEQLGTLTMWDDRQIGAGDAWFEEITKKLNRCTVAILLVSADFLASKFCMREEVPPLLERRRRDGMLIVPILIQPCFWEGIAWLRAIQMLPRDGVAIAELAKAKRNRVFTEVAKSVSSFAEEGKKQTLAQAGTSWPAPLGVDIDRLPTSGYDLVGRDEELRLLNDTWDQDKINVISLVAWGGVGKSTVVNKWCEYLRAENFRGARRVFGWSFFSQGANKPAASAEDLIAAALEFFGDPDPSAGSPWAKGERLADLVRREKALLILDGLEPLQDPYQGIKDPSVQRLIEELARDNAGLCVITTREPAKELADFSEETLELNLEQISAEAGRALLRIKGVRGTDAELEQASRDFGKNALAINLLASYLRGIDGHQIRDATEVPDLDIPEDQGRHPRRVMEAFAQRFGEGPELELLHVLGLFDRPASGDCIDALKTPPSIPGLTEHLTKLSERAWLRLLDDLRDLGLIADASHYASNELDAHPLVREHFGARLKVERLGAWQAGHGRLYEHLRDNAKQYPDTLVEMAPLFQAMHHGCQAERHQEALDEVYWARIVRRNKFYATRRLGAYGADLAALAGLFDPPFEKPVAPLTEDKQAWILNTAAYDLRALGRLPEAIEPQQAGLERRVVQEDWQNAAICARNLSQLRLALGDVVEAIVMGELSLDYAERSADDFERVGERVALADALHYTGELARAKALFEEAEAIQAESDSDHPRLCSVQGHHYCDLLLAYRRPGEVRERAAQSLAWFKGGQGSLLTVALDRLSLGRAALALGEHGEAETQLDRAVDGLRRAGTVHHVPRCLLARRRCSGRSAISLPPVAI